MLKVVGLICAASLLSAPAFAQYQQQNTFNGGYGTGSNPSNHYVAPHLNSNGSYTGGHYQTNPNNTQLDNYGTRGNLNPYTGTYGTRRPGY